jgi:hypothetical protein
MLFHVTALKEVSYHNAVRLSKAWIVFARSDAGIVGSNPTRCMDVCVCVRLFCVCVVLCALQRADHSSKESYRLCEKDYEPEEGARAQQKGCRAIDEWMNEWMLYA